MAKTNKDIALKSRITSLIEQCKDKTDKEIIHMLMGVCGLSQRTATEHFNAYKGQQTFKEYGLKEVCEHQWSQPFGTASGLVRECSLCGLSKEVKG